MMFTALLNKRAAFSGLTYYQLIDIISIDNTNMHVWGGKNLFIDNF